ncbi:MAG: hypothetical protein ABI885_08655 [Gammaproteobacteria bacterium]
MSITRREFVQGMMAMGATVAVAAGFEALLLGEDVAANEAEARAAGAAAAPGHRPPTVSFHLDQPYLDVSGHALPYSPPAGARAAQSLAELSEAAFQCCFLGS